ncbi:DEAD-domain-containing protein [Sistotremastrum niveocremeum HHB9708]|uniref:RNA helicase n=2 Tax=Sistotremastraceae TaxID=3402574 RepID=A0A164VI36_9AGAM|nr:DEAD-domain-containing protein [Sistotremastrum niveocremeum HHB9708]KZT40034.1 DEAD-domain-containing protein [Sistotremastrum suecicum HHB10207 ss-3]
MSLQKDDDGFITAAAALSVNDPPPPPPPAESAEPAGPSDASRLLKSSFDVHVTLADHQADPNSPLYSIKTFDELGLSPDLLKGIYGMGFSKPSKIQERALPLLLANPPQNMIGQSQSGTGKTAAFVLTMLSRVDVSLNAVQAICITPTRELARQIMTVVNAMGKFTQVTTEYAIRDHNIGSKITQHIVVGTPGTMSDFIRRRIIDPTKVKVFVLDEADNMLDQNGLGDHTLRVKNEIMKHNKNFQIVLFSATFPDTVRTFASKFAPRANEIRLKAEELSVEGIKQFYMDCKDEDAKFQVLVELYNILTIGSSIIFCKKRENADEIARRMVAQGHQVTSLHGAKDAMERDRTIDDFREGKTKVLITTNVAARGLDILQVNMVINYDMPVDARGQPDWETYLHRVGRTGRFGRTGIAINFVHDKRTWQDMHAMEQALGMNIARIETNDFDEMEETLKKSLKA